MLPELGHFALILAMLLAALQASLASQDLPWAAIAGPPQSHLQWRVSS